MRSCTEQKEFEFFFPDAVDKQPVWFDMAFTKSAKIARQIVVSVSFIKLLPRRQGIDYLFES